MLCRHVEGVNPVKRKVLSLEAPRPVTELEPGIVRWISRQHTTFITTRLFQVPPSKKNSTLLVAGMALDWEQVVGVGSRALVDAATRTPPRRGTWQSKCRHWIVIVIQNQSVRLPFESH
eukprot:6147778-Pyramimonas_sp.AAC.1